MMAQSGNYLYHRGDKFQAVNLPYGEGGVSLYLFLPDKGSSLDEFLKGLSFQKWEEVDQQLQRHARRREAASIQTRLRRNAK